MGVMKKREPLLVTAVERCEDLANPNGSYEQYHSVRWDRNAVKEVLVDFDNYTIETILHSGDKSVIYYGGDRLEDEKE